jgi:uncharacterized membrane protein YphA (DoxX/SURF4 family)
MTGHASTQAQAPGVAAGVEAPPATRLRRAFAHPALTLVSRLVLGGIFILSGLTKLGVPAAFTASIVSYEVPLPSFIVQAMAVGLPPIELGLGIWLVLGLFTRFAAGACVALMLVFLTALAQAWARGLSPDCGCFAGPDGNPIGLAAVRALGPIGTFLTTGKAGWGTIVRDLVFLAMALHLFFVPTVFSIDQWRRRAAGVPADDLAAPADAPLDE